MIHELKCWPEPFTAMRIGIKTFEYRRDDRKPRYAVGDILKLREWAPWDGKYTGRIIWVRVGYIVRLAFGVPKGYCAMSIKKIRKPRAKP